MKAVEVAKRVYENRRKYFENLEFYLNIIKQRVKRRIPGAKLYLFGSTVEGKIHPLSDIDIAIVSDSVPERVKDIAKFKLEILENFELSPFELHVLNEREWEFYRKFIKKFKEIL